MKKNFSPKLQDDDFGKAIIWEGKNEVAFLVLHGWSAVPCQSKAFIDWLKKRDFWVFAPVLKGHGTMPEELEKVKWREWLEQVEEEIEKIKKNPKIKRVFLVGISMGGNLALLASIKKKVDGVILVGTPVHLKNHFWIWLGVWLVPIFKKNIQKKYPAGVNSDFLKKTSYRYFPIKSVRESLRCIRAALFSLKKVTVPLLILQSSSDYLVAKYSPWVIFNGTSSRIKKMYWIRSQNNSHVLLDSEMTGAFSIIETFIKLVLKESKR